MLGILQVERGREEEERKVTFRFRLRFPEILPPSTREHLRAARKESLLAIRDFATQTIDRRIEALEREKPTVYGRPPVKPPVAQAVAEEEEIPAEEVPLEGKGNLQSMIMGLIAEKPEGMKLTEIAEATGEARVKVGNITRMLVEESKIRKEGLLYFVA